MQAISTPASVTDAEVTKKPLIFIMGVAAYLTGVSGLLALILAMGGLLPLGAIMPLTDRPWAALVINALLVGLFGLQHTIMARPAFKERLTRIIPAACERSAFVFVTGIIAMLIVALWQPVGGVLWQAAPGTAAIIAWSAFAFGWTYLLAATFAIDHFDLFGLRQTWLAAVGRPYTKVRFKEHWMYRISRHPIMAGAVIGFWCAPTMTMTNMTMAALFTAYVFIGIRFEERDLVGEFGQDYISYRQRVGMLFTVGRQAGPAA